MLCPLTLERESWSPRDDKERSVHIPLSERPDGDLVRDWCAGQPEALRILVDRHRSAAFGLALRLCGDRDRAEDLVQDAFLRALGRIRQFDTRLPFRPWLYRILGHLYIDDLRKRRELFSEEAVEPPPREEHPEEGLLLDAVLACLPVPQRAILLLQEMGGLSYEELAQLFGIPLGTVRSRLAHARLAFKEAYRRLTQEVAR
jgi:RNA polymerase sigma-70 factor (ECF subfamily)